MKFRCRDFFGDCLVRSTGFARTVNRIIFRIGTTYRVDRLHPRKVDSLIGCPRNEPSMECRELGLLCFESAAAANARACPGRHDRDCGFPVASFQPPSLNRVPERLGDLHNDGRTVRKMGQKPPRLTVEILSYLLWRPPNPYLPVRSR